MSATQNFAEEYPSASGSGLLVKSGVHLLRQEKFDSHRRRAEDSTLEGGEFAGAPSEKLVFIEKERQVPRFGSLRR